MSDRFRFFLMVLFLVGAVGTGVELWLLEHTEDYWQWVPLVLLGLSVVVVGLVAATRRAWALRTFQGVAALMVVSAGIGVWQHYSGNTEFELEMYPSRRGWELFWESLKGATPALAPGMMLHLGLLGFLTTFKHPAFQSGRGNAKD